MVSPFIRLIYVSDSLSNSTMAHCRSAIRVFFLIVTWILCDTGFKKRIDRWDYHKEGIYGGIQLMGQLRDNVDHSSDTETILIGGRILDNS